MLRSPPRIRLKNRSEAGCPTERDIASTSEQLDIDEDRTSQTSAMEIRDSMLADIINERVTLESFLFNENNKISKSAIKFILNKWAFMEAMLYEDRLENQKLRATYHKEGPARLYSQMAPGTADPVASSMVPEKEKRINKEKHEVVLIEKPLEDKDKRNNEQIKEELVKMLGKVRKDLRIKSIRQMRGRGIVLEVKDRKDVDIIEKANLGDISLRTGEPSKINPSIIIYDVEPKDEVEQLKEEFINKNFDSLDKETLENLKGEIIFRYNYKTPKNRMNWVVQLPAILFESLVNRGRICILWRSYRVKEYLNIMRCFKCHGYGHKAENCESSEQLCECCGDKGHFKKDCPTKNTPKCINCIRNRRKDYFHSVRDSSCPEYKRQVDIYRNKIKW